MSVAVSKRSLFRVAVAAAVSLSASLSFLACGGPTAAQRPSRLVDEELVRVFPPEGKRWTYEAENEVIIALDRLDTARDAEKKIEVEIARLEDARKAAEKRGSGMEIVRARKAFLEARLEQARGETAAMERGVACSRANLELTKARLVVRFDLPVEASYLKPFESQYESCAAKLVDAKKDADRLAAQAGQARQAWHKVRDDFVVKTGDHNHGVWID